MSKTRVIEFYQLVVLWCIYDYTQAHGKPPSERLIRSELYPRCMRDNNISEIYANLDITYHKFAKSVLLFRDIGLLRTDDAAISNYTDTRYKYLPDMGLCKRLFDKIGTQWLRWPIELPINNTGDILYSKSRRFDYDDDCCIDT